MPTSTTKRTSPAQSPAKQMKYSAAELFERGRKLIFEEPTSPAKAEAVTSQTPDVCAAPPRYAKVAERIRRTAKDRLEGHFKEYLAQANPEEIHAMTAILDEWDQHIHFALTGQANPPLSREVALYSAIEWQLNQCHAVTVPNDDMIPLVEAYIQELSTSYDLKKLIAGQQPQSEHERLEGQLRREMEVFFQDAGMPSLKFMRRVIALWNELATDPDIRKAVNDKKITNILLAVAMEIEIPRAQAEAYADVALKGAA
ncbi:MAG TPA: hypothetical protein VFC21_06020 [Bryobacteraceae bacterium]|nr:hypothetical protein [Bryobacteraceae bacterium]